MTLRRADRLALRSLASPDLSIDELVERTGLRAWEVRNFLRARGLPFKRVKSGRKPRADLHENALRLRRTGFSYAEIGRVLGVTTQRAWQVVRATRTLALEPASARQPGSGERMAAPGR